MTSADAFIGRPRKTAGAAPRLHPLAKGAGFSVLILFLIPLLVPDVMSLQAGSLRLPPLRVGIIVFFIPALVMFFSRNGGRLYNFDWLYFGFAIWTMMAIISNRGLSGSVEKVGVVLLEYVVLYLLIQGAIRRVSQIRFFIWSIIGIIVVLGALAIVEALTHRYFLMQAAYTLAGRGVYIGPFFGQVGNDVRLGMMRATSIFNHPILYGLFCGVFFSYAWYLPRTLFGRIFWGGAVAVATFFSLSAGPLMALLVQFIVVGVEVTTRKLPNRAPILLWLTAGFLMLVQLVSESGIYRLVQLVAMDPGSTSYRRAIWQNGIDDVMRNPIFGIRPEDWTRPGWMSPSMDNQWLLQMITGGIPSLILLALCLIVLTRRLFRRPDAEIPPEIAALRRAWAYSILAMVVCGTTVAFFEKAQPLFAILVGLGGVTFRLLDDWERAATPLARTPDRAARQAPDAPEANEPAPAPGRRRSVL